MPASWRICAAEPRAPGVGHHVDGVERLLVHRLPLLRSSTFCTRSWAIIDLADPSPVLPPDVDHLVVALARRSPGPTYCCSISLTSFSARSIRLCFSLGTSMSSMARSRCRRARGQPEAALHQLVGEDHGLLQAAAAEAHVDEREISFLSALLSGERQALAAGSPESSARPTVGPPAVSGANCRSCPLGPLDQAHTAILAVISDACCPARAAASEVEKTMPSPCR